MTPELTPRDPFVVSEDIHILLAQWAARHPFFSPLQLSPELFKGLRREMILKLREYFGEVEFVTEAQIRQNSQAILREVDCPLVSLDETYHPDGDFKISSTRLTDQCGNSLQGYGSRNLDTLERQYDLIASGLNGRGRDVQLIDDVIYSGDNIIEIIKNLGSRGVRVARVMGAVVVREGKRKIETAFPGIRIDACVPVFESVTDEVCERDFYVGIPYGGRQIGYGGDNGNQPLVPERCIPYILPFADGEKVKRWSSIPERYHEEWSLFCLRQSIKLWKAVEEATRRVVHCTDIERLPFSIASDDSSFVGRLEEAAKCLEVLI